MTARAGTVRVAVIAILLMAMVCVGGVGATAWHNGSISNHAFESSSLNLGKIQQPDRILLDLVVRDDQQDVTPENIVAVSENGNVALDYTMDILPQEGGVVVQVLAQDNIGMWMPVWEGDAYHPEGTWQFNLADAGLSNDGRIYLFRMWRPDDEI